MSIVIAAEPVTRWYDEAAPLFRAHWEEVGTFRDAIELNPDIEAVRALEARGMWPSWTARDAAGALCGYVCTLVSPHLHYKPHRMAYVDLIYVTPAHRRGTVAQRLIRAMEQELPPVSKIIFHVKTDHDFGRLLERMGYVLTEKNFEKLVR